MHEVGLVLLALVVGAIGTLIGAGGGFILAPLLLLLQPSLHPDQLSAVTLAVVFVNASVGSVSYWLRGRVDVRSAVGFALAAIPAAIAGVAVNRHLPRQGFALGLGAMLVVGGILLLWRPINRDAPSPTLIDGSHAPPRDVLGPKVPHRRSLGLTIAAAVGFLSSLLGIGGGIVHVPVLVRVLGFPVHCATATSHLVLALTAGVAVAMHLAAGSYAGHWPETSWLALGVVIGAPIGATLSGRLHGTLILRLLAIALIVAGARTLFVAVAG